MFNILEFEYFLFIEVSNNSVYIWVLTIHLFRSSTLSNSHIEEEECILFYSIFKEIKMC